MAKCPHCNVENVDSRCGHPEQYCYSCCSRLPARKNCTYHFSRMGLSLQHARAAAGLSPSPTHSPASAPASAATGSLPVPGEIEPSPLSPSFSAAHPEPVVCNALLDELRGEEQLRLVDLCPVCHVMVARHQRLPLGTSPLPTGSSAYSRSSTQLGKNTTLPQWKLHGNVHAKPFLDKVEHLLLADDVDKKAWPRLLLKAVPNVHDSSWVKLNIVEANVDWSTARHLFTAQFEVLTWTEQSQQLYEQCRQGAREPVQEYSHRFMTCVTELRYEDNDQHVILHFQLGLIPSIQAKIRDRVHLYRDLQKQLSGFSVGSLTSSAPYTILSLKQMTDLAINIERSAQVSSSMLASGASSPSASPSTSGDFPSTFSPFTSQSTVSQSCLHHPYSTSHTTEDCRKPDIREHENSPTFSGIGNSSTDGYSAFQTGGAAVPAIVYDKRGNPVKCYNCGANHYANDKSCPNGSGRIIRSAASGAQPSAQSSLSPMTAPLQSTSLPEALSDSTFPLPAEALSASPLVLSGASLLDAVVCDDRLKAASVVISEPRATQLAVYLLVHGRMYSTLIDTGAEVSFADAPLVTSLSVPITPSAPGRKIRLAHADVLIDRCGSAPLDATALFSSPAREAISFRCVFELMPVRTADNEHHFIIGRDLIPVLFPQGLPLAYLPRQTSSSVAVAASSTLVEPPAVNAGSGTTDSARLDTASPTPTPMISSTTTTTPSIQCIVMAITASIMLMLPLAFVSQSQQLLNGLLLAILLSMLYSLQPLTGRWWGRGLLTNQLYSLYDSLRCLLSSHSFLSAAMPGVDREFPSVITDHRTSSGIYEYLAHWKGFADSSTSIENFSVS